MGFATLDGAEIKASFIGKGKVLSIGGNDDVPEQGVAEYVTNFRNRSVFYGDSANFFRMKNTIRKASNVQMINPKEGMSKSIVLFFYKLIMPGH